MSQHVWPLCEQLHDVAHTWLNSDPPFSHHWADGPLVTHLTPRRGSSRSVTQQRFQCYSRITIINSSQAVKTSPDTKQTTQGAVMDERLFYKCDQKQVHFTDKKDPCVCAATPL